MDLSLIRLDFINLRLIVSKPEIRNYRMLQLTNLAVTQVLNSLAGDWPGRGKTKAAGLCTEHRESCPITPRSQKSLSALTLVSRDRRGVRVLVMAWWGWRGLAVSELIRGAASLSLFAHAQREAWEPGCHHCFHT